MSTPDRWFLSIRKGELSKNDGMFSITARKRKIDDNGSLYYKQLLNRGNRKKVHGLSRITKNDPGPFVNTVAKQLKKKEEGSKDILFFIHGYHPFKNSLHTHLLDKLQDQYTGQENFAGFGAIIFFSWPNKGLQWKEDDEANEIGNILGRNYKFLFTGLRNLADELGGRLILMTQSFGHHILNGLLQTFPTRSGQPRLFEATFMMAADIPFQCLDLPYGITVANPIGNAGGTSVRAYNLLTLRNVSDRTFVFTDPHDVVLKASQTNLLSKYKRLGRKGPGARSPGWVHEVPYDKYKEGMHLGTKINDGLILGRILFRQKRYNKRHQYFVTNDLVRDEIIKLIG